MRLITKSCLSLWLVLCAMYACAVVTPGLYEARYNGVRQVYANTYSANTMDRVVLGPFAANAKNNNVVLNQSDSSITNWPPFGVAANGWADNRTFYYSGYIFIGEGSNTVTFAAAFDDSKRLCIDGAELFRNATYTTLGTATRTLVTGWHKFDLWYDNGTGGYGPNAWGANDIGFGVDWQGRGSIVRADFVFPVDPGDGSLFSATMPPGYAVVTAGGVRDVIMDAATLSADVEISGGSGTLRFYYGLTDGGSVADAWDAYVDLETPVTASGRYETRLTGLATAVMYYYRPAFVDEESGRIFFASEGRSVIPLDGSAPASFRWIGGTTGNWGDPNWLNLDALARTLPGVPGDKISLTNAVALTLSTDVSFAELTQAGAFNASLVPSQAGIPVSLDAQGGMSKITTVASGSLTLGAAAPEMVVDLKNPLWMVPVGTSPYTVGLFLKARLTGGTELAPANLYLGGTASGRTYIQNTGNSFRGDVYIGTNAVAIFGAGNAVNAVLGHANNQIIFSHPSGRLIWWSAGTGPHASALDRTIRGHGVIQATNIDTYNNTADRYLCLGPNAVLEPSSLTAPTGTITIIGSVVALASNATVRLDLPSATQCDKLAVGHYTGSSDTWGANPKVADLFCFTNRLELILGDPEIPAYTQWTVMTVANVKAFTFAPSYITPGFSAQVVGTAAPWSVVVTKLDSGPAVQNEPASEIGEDRADVSADVVKLDPTGQGTLRVYYGESDGVDNPQAWAHCAVYPNEVTVVGKYSLPLASGLQVGHTYYYRHSISNSAGEKFALDTYSFTTRLYDAPDTFVWVATNADWFAEGVWRPVTPSLRKTPQFMGDKIVVHLREGGSSSGALISRQIALSQDVLVSGVKINDGENHGVTFTAENPEQPVTLTFDSVTAAQVEISCSGSLHDLNLGQSLADPLTLALNKPFLVSKDAAYQFNVPCYARLIGGTDAAPSDLTVKVESDEYGHMHFGLINPNNTFRGDIYVGSRTMERPGTTELLVGKYGTALFDDAMLGDRKNKITLQHNSALSLITSPETPVILNRHVLGNGVVCAGSTDKYVGGTDNMRPTAGLHLGADASLTPHAKSGSTGMGMIRVEASSFSDEAQTQYAFKVTPEPHTNDVVQVNVTGPVSLRGKVLIDSPVYEVPLNQTWTLMTIAPNATPLDCQLKVAKGGNVNCNFSLKTTGDTTTGWTVTATSLAKECILFLR